MGNVKGGAAVTHSREQCTGSYSQEQCRDCTTGLVPYAQDDYSAESMVFEMDDVSEIVQQIECTGANNPPPSWIRYMVKG